MAGATSNGCGWIAAAIFGLIALISIFGKSPTPPAPPLPEPTGAAQAFSNFEAAYVTASSLNARSAPASDGEVQDKLSRNEAVMIVSRSGEWLQINRGGRKLWVSAKHVSSSPPARPQGLFSSTKSQSSRSRGTSRPAKHHSSRPARLYNDSGCPCSGRLVCIGPRGGRYCITSGGNKRYGV